MRRITRGRTATAPVTYDPKIPSVWVSSTLGRLHVPFAHTVRDIAGRPGGTDGDADPYLWLEDVTGEKALGWVKQRNAEATAELAKTKEFQTLNARLLRILDSQERIPFIEKRGALYYNFWRDERNQRGLWVVV
jgi:hypothetical protein